MAHCCCCWIRGSGQDHHSCPSPLEKYGEQDCGVFPNGSKIKWEESEIYWPILRTWEAGGRYWLQVKMICTYMHNESKILRRSSEKVLSTDVLVRVISVIHSNLFTWDTQSPSTPLVCLQPSTSHILLDIKVPRLGHNHEPLVLYLGRWTSHLVSPKQMEMCFQDMKNVMVPSVPSWFTCS